MGCAQISLATTAFTAAEIIILNNSLITFSPHESPLLLPRSPDPETPPWLGPRQHRQARPKPAFLTHTLPVGLVRARP